MGIQTPADPGRSAVPKASGNVNKGMGFLALLYEYELHIERVIRATSMQYVVSLAYLMPSCLGRSKMIIPRTRGNDVGNDQPPDDPQNAETNEDVVRQSYITHSAKIIPS